MRIERRRPKGRAAHTRAEGAAQEIEAQYRALLDAIPDAIFRLSREGRLLDFSPAKGQEEAAHHADFLGRTVNEVMPTDLAAEIMRHLEQALETGDTQVFEYRSPVPLPNGTLRDFEARIAASGHDEVLAIVRDITKRKRAEKGLRESGERFRGLSQATLEGVFVTDDTHRVLDVNSQAAAMLGYELSEMIGMDAFGFIAPDCRDLVLQQVRSRYERSYEAQCLRKDGTTFPVEFCGKAAFFKGHPVRVGVMRDISERKREEEALRESEGRFRRLSKATLEGIFIHDGARILDANPQAAATHGYELSEFIGMEIWDFIAPDCHDLVRQQVRLGYEGPYEARGVRKDGTTFPMELCGKAAFYRGHQVRVGVMRDMSERKRAEAEAQAAREELLGRVDDAVRRGNPYDLTFRELAVLFLIVMGKADKEIALQLAISPRTASKHVENILQKMGVASRTEASVRALREGLVGDAR